jgi:para-nitrobenzyl esterase
MTSAVFGSSLRAAVTGALVLAVTAGASGQTQVKTAGGTVEGVAVANGAVRAFKGIPYAAPPVGDLRWKPPQPAAPWTGVRKADAFGARCVQARVFGDMVFRDEASEDCLNLNVWTPAKSAGERLPVMVWIYGGGFQAGSASEARQDGERLAQKGVVVVSMNYRLGILGFFSHPELTKESPHKASGNYGLLDQNAALKWVQQNIAAFGGDPKNVTIFGESAGSFSVSAQMASPLSQGLFQRAIGESGAFFPGPNATLPVLPVAETEKNGETFGTSIGAASLAALRAKPADEILKAMTPPMMFRFAPNIDGYFLPASAASIFAAGKQAKVPLLAGWNADEVRAGVVLSPRKPTAQSFAADAKTRYGDHAEALLKLYPAATDAEALESAASLGGDLFIGYSTWKWLEVHGQTGGAPVYRYSFDRKIPIPPDTKRDGVAVTSADIGARHAGEIEYVFGALDSIPKVTWTDEDRKLSDAMMTYWSNFARTGDPNGGPTSGGLPKWPTYTKAGGYQLIHLDTTIRTAPDAQRGRYELLDTIANKPGTGSR